MRLAALLCFAALSVFAAGCATEDTTGDDSQRPATAKHSGAADSNATGDTGAATGDGLAKPVTPADGPAAKTPSAANTNLEKANPAIKAIACATDEDSVSESYRLALQREPDPGGLQGWVGAIQNGDTRLGVLEKIIDSQEFLDGYAGLSNEGFATFLYKSFFNREPDAAGLQGWVGALNGGQSRAAVAKAFVESPEFKDPNSNHAVACYF